MADRREIAFYSVWMIGAVLFMPEGRAFLSRAIWGSSVARQTSQPPVGAAVTTDSPAIDQTAMVRDAVLAGAGAALVPKMLVTEDIDAGRLVLWGAHAGPKVEIWALQNSRRLTSSKARAFLTTLTSLA